MQSNFFNISFFHYYSTAQHHLSKEAKVAAIIGLCEENRKKKRLFRGEDEQIKFITRFEYPLDIHPWNNKSLMLKRFFTEDNIVDYGFTIDVHKFIGEIRRTSINVKEYIKMLEENINLFKQFKNIDKIRFDFLLKNSDSSKLLINEIQKNKEINKSQQGLILVSPEHEKPETRLELFDRLWKKSQKDLDNLTHIADIIKNEFEKTTIKNKEEINLIEKQTSNEIEKYMPSINTSVKKIEKIKSETINKIEKSTKREISYLLKTKIKFENKLRLRKQQEARFKREKQRKRETHDKHGEQFWSKELVKCKKEITLIENDVLRCENDIKKLTEQMSEQIYEITNRYSGIINNEWKKITEISNKKDSVIKKIRINHIRLEEINNSITRDIMNQIEQKKLEIENFKSYTISWNCKNRMLIYVPFYLTRYSSINKIRYDIISPLLINVDRKKISVQGKRLIGLNDNLSNIFEPFSKDILDMIYRDVITKMKNDADFMKKIDEDAKKCNIIAEEGFSNLIKKGFKELVETSLLNRDEVDEILIHENKWSKN